MQPLIVTAHMRSGFAAAFPWAISLDGILAYQTRLSELGDEAFALSHGIVEQQTPCETLPLQKEHFDSDWWYQCSRPIYVARAVHTSHLHRRFNALEAETRVSGTLSAIQTTKGPYKNARLAISRYITEAVHWHCVGDAAQIQALLQGVTHIGAQRRSGFGAVRHWDVQPGGDEHMARFCRPVPAAFAAQHGMQGITMEWPIRSPARHPDNQRTCVIPDAPDAGQQ